MHTPDFGYCGLRKGPLERGRVLKPLPKTDQSLRLQHQDFLHGHQQRQASSYIHNNFLTSLSESASTMRFFASPPERLRWSVGSNALKIWGLLSILSSVGLAEKSQADYFVHSLPGAPEPLLKMHAGHIEVTPEHHGNMCKTFSHNTSSLSNGIPQSSGIGKTDT